MKHLRAMSVPMLCVALAAFGVAAAAAPARADDADAKMKVYETKYYSIHSDLDIEMVREAAVRLTCVAEEYHERTRDFAVGGIHEKLPFYLFSTMEDYQAAGGMKGSSGVFDGSRLMAVCTPKMGGYVWHTIQHEGFHQFAHYTISKQIPVWLNEGLAEYFGEGVWTGDGLMTGLVPPGRLKRIQEMIKAEKLVPFSRMVTMSHSEWNEQMTLENYDQGWSMVHFLVHADNGKYQRPLTKYIAALAALAPPMDAFTAQFGTNTKAFQDRYCDYWLSQGADPTRELYLKADVATLTSFLARAQFLKMKFEDFAAFASAAGGGKIQIDGTKNFNLWLPQTLVQQVLGHASDDGAWSLDNDKAGVKLTLKGAGGTTFTGTVTSVTGEAAKVFVKVTQSPNAGAATTKPAGK